jgi:hypothetical protein
LVKNAKSDYIIVHPENSSPSQIYSAEELQKFIHQMTGAHLDIQTDAKALPSKAIILGNSKYTASILGKSPDMEKLGSDGFHIFTKTPYLFIIGGRKRGTLYGVYELLEKYGNCRWFSKTYSIIPKRKNWNIPEINDLQTPAFAIRDIFYYDVLKDQDLAARLRSNGHGKKLDKKHGGNLYYAGRMCHTFYDLMPPKEFFAEHPEYFSQWGTERRSQHGSLCLTNPDVEKIVSKRVIEMLDKDPEASFIDLSASDGGTPCVCEKCAEVDKREGTYAGSVIEFCNKVAAIVEKKYPHVYIETLAYADTKTQTPPKHLRTRSNVIPRVCTVRCDFSKPINDSPYPENLKFAKELAGWKKVSKQLLVWDYVTNFYHYLAPFPNFNSLQGNMKYFRDNHVKGILSLGNYSSPHGEFAELRAWIIAKLLWNPDTDIEKLYADFFEGYYGKAAPLVRKYFDELQQLSYADKNILTIKSPIEAKWFPDGFFKHAKKLFDQAEALVKDDPQRLYNVRTTAIPVYYALWKRWPEFKLSWEWRNGEPCPTGVPDGYMQIATELYKRINEGKITHIIEHPLKNSRAFSELNCFGGNQRSIKLRDNELQIIIAPLHGGRVSMLSLNGNHNFIKPELGGISLINNPKTIFTQNSSSNRIIKSNTTQAALEKQLIYHYSINRNFKLDGNTLSINNSFISRSSRDQTINPVMSFALDLKTADAVYYRSGVDKWNKVDFPENQKFALKRIPLENLISNDFTIVSALSQLGVKIRLPEISLIKNLYLYLDDSTKSIRVIVELKAQTLKGTLGGKNNLNYPCSITPLKRITGLPKGKPLKHKSQVVELEDAMITLISPAYGEVVKDSEASDKQALKVKNVPTWSVQWDVNPELFIPNCNYKVEVYIRAEKSGEPGEIFNTGVYDYNTRKAADELSIQDFQLKDGYKCYEVAIFRPSQKQRLWLSAGRYNKKEGEKSAVKSIFIDKIRFVQTSGESLEKPEKTREPSDSIIIEATEIPVRSTAWSRLVIDKRTDTKRAMRLTTYPCWNLMWDIKPEWFKSGKYLLSARIRVEKNNVEGEAFRAGLYDYKTRKSTGEIIIKNNNASPGYKWYKIAEFSPGKKQRVWIGSGRFDKKKGEKPAVKAVYVDKLKFSRTKTD